jgi:hypothetical protein
MLVLRILSGRCLKLHDDPQPGGIVLECQARLMQARNRGNQA